MNSLSGRRVVVTRPERNSRRLLKSLLEQGAEPILLPAIEIVPPESWDAVDQTLDDIGRFDWIVFTSQNGVVGFCERLETRPIETVAAVNKLACIGPATARTLGDHGFKPDFVAADPASESLANEMAPFIRDKRILLVQGNKSRGVLRPELEKLAKVTLIEVYRQRECRIDSLPPFQRLVSGDVDDVLLTSPNIARSFIGQLPPAALERIRNGAIRLVTISPITSSAVRECQLPIAAEATTPNDEGLIEALVKMGSRSNGMTTANP